MEKQMLTGYGKRISDVKIDVRKRNDMHRTYAQETSDSTVSQCWKWFRNWFLKKETGNMMWAAR